MDKKGNNSVFLTKNDQKEQKMTKKVLYLTADFTEDMD